MYTGCKVRLVKPGKWKLAASKGALAIITAVHPPYIIVHWIDHLSNGQVDGGYIPKQFEPVEDCQKCGNKMVCITTSSLFGQGGKKLFNK
jgi:hypothetical protein